MQSDDQNAVLGAVLRGTHPTVSLCVITGNEELHVERFLDAFGPAFDELCLVRAIGRNVHDHTVQLAKKWCEKNGKAWKFAEYTNAHLTFCHPDAPMVLDDDPCTWPHVDDFAAARNMSWAMATGDYQLWADLDDVIDDESAKIIRQCTLKPEYDLFYFHYSIPTSGEHNYRERMFKRGTSHWSQPVHENCHIEWDKCVTPGKPHACNEKNVIYTHQPLADKEKIRDPFRNMRIMKFHLRYIHGFAYAIHQEHFFHWGAKRQASDMEMSFRWAKIAQQADTLSPLQMQLLLNMAEMCRNVKDYDGAIGYAWDAIRVNPGRREPWGVLGELELESGQAHRATVATQMMQVIQPVADTGIPVSDRFMGQSGVTLRTRALRAAGDEAGARELEDRLFTRSGARFSLLHATRGRPETAIFARNQFLKTAYDQLSVEHIFGIDEDDAASLEALKHYRHIVIREPRGCVKAWNALAAESRGAILMQMSDDWIPSLHWDARLWQKAEGATKERWEFDPGESDVTAPRVGMVPLVFAVSDNHRTDALLCMAILTRARYHEQRDEPTEMPMKKPCDPYLFSPEYFGVYSDNEFTARAYRDGVVIDCLDIAFDHQHPIFFGKAADEWDETHKRQNDVARYVEGAEIFARRNPWAVHPDPQLPSPQ